MAKRFSMTDADRTIVTEAVTRAEDRTDAEIVTIVARRSDAYHDVGLHYAILAAFLVLGLATAFPHYYERAIIWLMGGWEHQLSLQTVLLVLLGHMLLKFLAVRYLLAIPALRMLFTPGATKTRRVHRRATLLFRTAAEARTAKLTGVLIYLSLDEHRAEILADQAIASKVTAETWGEIMVAMIEEVRAGRVAEGMAIGIERAGLILAQHCPKTEDDRNELPDRLIEL